MLSGSRKKRGSDEYVFIDGRAMRADEAVRIQLDEPTVPGQAEVVLAPGQEASAAGAAGSEGTARSRAPKKGTEGLKARLRHDMAVAEMEAPEKEGAQAVDDGTGASSASDEVEPLAAAFQREARAMRRKYLVCGVALAALVVFSLCVSSGYYGVIYSPIEVLSSYAGWWQILWAQITDPVGAAQVQAAVLAACPHYYDINDTALDVLKYAVCGVMLALSGALYQNAFRNPIAAPSMLGVANGVNVASLVLVLVVGAGAVAASGLYYLFAYVGGLLMLGLVMLGGKWISPKGSFNVVNMLLIGTVLSQLTGVIITYVQTNIFTDADWLAYYTLQTGVSVDSIYTWISLAVGLVVSLVPVLLFRFRLNLVSFSDEEARLLGVNPNRLRLVALACGSVMILTAQVNAGQVAMISLVVPFVVRAAFGAEFRKQLWGNVLVGAFILIACWDVASFVTIPNFELPVGTVVSVVVLPLFVWMIALRQRSWE